MTLNELLVIIYDEAAKTNIGENKVKIITDNRTHEVLDAFYNKKEKTLYIQMEIK